MRRLSRLSLVAAVAVLSSAVCLPAVQVSAQAGGSMSGAADAAQKVAEAQAKAKQRREAAQKNAASKLETTKLRICQNHEQAIDKLMASLSRRGDDRLQLIDRVSERVQGYYVGSMLSVDNYASLLTAATSARTAARSAIASVQDSESQFGCTANDPQGIATSFKELVTARDAAIKEYRDAVKKLAQAVKAAATAQEKGSSAGSAVPTVEGRR